MADDKILTIFTNSCMQREKYYTNAPDDIELIQEILSARNIPYEAGINLSHSLPRGGEATGAFKDLASEVEANHFAQESKRLAGVQQRFTEYLASQDN